MARVKIEITGKPLMRVCVPVRITDLNYGNHTGNDALVSILHEARASWLRHHKFTELDIEGTGLIMSDLLVSFKKEAFYGDVLEVELFATELTKKSFDLLYDVKTKRDNEVLGIAMAKTTMISYDYALKKVINVPQSLLKILN